MDPGHHEAEAITDYLNERMEGYQILADTEGLAAHFTLVQPHTSCVHHVEG
jgi:hypothetical protein